MYIISKAIQKVIVAYLEKRKRDITEAVVTCSESDNKRDMEDILMDFESIVKTIGLLQYVIYKNGKRTNVNKIISVSSDSIVLCHLFFDYVSKEYSSLQSKCKNIILMPETPH